MAYSTSAIKESGWEIFEVCFDNFERLPFERGEYVESAKFTSFGHQWCLAIYPGGEVFSGNGRMSPSICITNQRVISKLILV